LVRPGVIPVKPAERVVSVEQSRNNGGGFPCFGAGANDPERLIVRGTLRQVNGNKVVTDQESKITSMLVGQLDESLVGKVISVKGVYMAQRPPEDVADQSVRIEESHSGAGGFLSVCEKAWIAGSIVTASAGIATGVILANQDSIPISR
jgi:hypothetical protein